MVPPNVDEILPAARAKLADVERRLASDAASLTDERWRDGAERLAAVRRAADELVRAIDRADASAARSEPS